MLSFFPRGVLDEILNLIESVSEGFSSQSCTRPLNNIRVATYEGHGEVSGVNNLQQGNVGFVVVFSLKKH